MKSVPNIRIHVFNSASQTQRMSFVASPFIAQNWQAWPIMVSPQDLAFHLPNRRSTSVDLLRRYCLVLSGAFSRDLHLLLFFSLEHILNLYGQYSNNCFRADKRLLSSRPNNFICHPVAPVSENLEHLNILLLSKVFKMSNFRVRFGSVIMMCEAVRAVILS